MVAVDSQSRVRFNVVSLCALEVTQRRFVLSGARLLTSFPVLCMLLQSAPLVGEFLFSHLVFIWFFIRVSHFSSDPRLSRFC